MAWENMVDGILASTLAGAATAVGAGMIFLLRSRMSDRLEDALLSIAAGIMLSASFFSLILPGLDVAAANGHSSLFGGIQVVGGMFLGMVMLSAINRVLPHEHFVQGYQGPESRKLRRMWLFVIAIGIHNFPEGMAVGVGFSAGELARGLPLAIGIAAQNIPEGFAVAAALMAVNYKPWHAFAISSLTGLVEAIGGVAGAGLAAYSAMALPSVLGLAAGAMLFIISDEIIPETHNRGNQTLATWCLMAGFCAMMLLDAAL